MEAEKLMKKFILSIEPGVYEKYKGVRSALEFLAIELAIENSKGDVNNTAITHIARNECLQKYQIQCNAPNAYSLGYYLPHTGYVVYCTIQKVTI